MKFQLGQTLEFIAVEWVEPDFAVTLLVEPVIRYSESMSGKELIEDVKLDIALDIQSGADTCDEGEHPFSQYLIGSVLAFVNNKLVVDNVIVTKYKVECSRYVFLEDEFGEVQSIEE